MLGRYSQLRGVFVDAVVPVASYRAHVRLSLGVGLADSLEALGTFRRQKVVIELWIAHDIFLLSADGRVETGESFFRDHWPCNVMLIDRFVVCQAAL